MKIKKNLKIGRSTVLFLLIMIIVGCSSDNGPAGPLPPDPPGPKVEEPFAEVSWKLELIGAAPMSVDGIMMSPVYAVRIILKTNESFDTEDLHFQLKLLTNYEEKNEIILTESDFVRDRKLQEKEDFYIGISNQVYIFPTVNGRFQNHPDYTIELEEFEFIGDSYWVNSEGEKIPFAKEPDTNLRYEILF